MKQVLKQMQVKREIVKQLQVARGGVSERMLELAISSPACSKKKRERRAPWCAQPATTLAAGMPGSLPPQKVALATDRTATIAASLHRGGGMQAALESDSFHHS